MTPLDFFSRWRVRLGYLQRFQNCCTPEPLQLSGVFL